MKTVTRKSVLRATPLSAIIVAMLASSPAIAGEAADAATSD